MTSPAHRILYTREAKRNIDKLDPSIRKLVRKAVESLATDPEKGKPLAHELAGLRSRRTADYRIIYRARSGELVVLVVALGHRREVYKRLGELLLCDKGTVGRRGRRRIEWNGKNIRSTA